MLELMSRGIGNVGSYDDIITSLGQCCDGNEESCFTGAAVCSAFSSGKCLGIGTNAVARAAAPPSSAAMRFSKTSVVGYQIVRSA